MSLRRALLVGLVLVLAGCTLPIVGNAPSYPERPAQLNDSSVVDYVEQYERAEIYRSVDAHKELDFLCASQNLGVFEKGRVVRTLCHPTNLWEYQSSPNTYFVNGSATIRSEVIPVRQQISSNRADNEDVTSASVRVFNFDHSTRTIAIEANLQNVTPLEPTFANETSLASDTGIVYFLDSMPRGNHTLTVTVDGHRAQRQWHVDEFTDRDQNAVAVVVTPSGSVSFSRHYSLREAISSEVERAAR